ncbi:hypothetical protein BDV38DRAFT_69114 [Aspergillus pseudotamarii]|uniref:Uncharacterized protein n=1 Tax=Aspergillus pseudotamarii TaxID=132259 RepID=A0A5N6SZ00_ASPPS|nr:uncharacterized protein BDV38DRAFT_69114 [Aspergillus pseudotamarii]KAE8138653.1 hypothetical protein BDV38DRAFT_69114 [Aspergillus pseudotamarii]
MNLKSIAAVLLTVSVVRAVQHQYTSLRTTSKEGHRIPALKSSQSVLGLGVDESRCYTCSSPCSHAVCCHGRFPQCCSDGVYCYCCED